MTVPGVRSGMPGLRLGAPGIYRSPQAVEPAYQPVRLDVAGFVGVALRGPVNECTLVSSWSDYERIFGGYERPGGGPDRMLPYAVSAFFAQGGVRAYVVRVAPPDGDGDAATAHYRLGPVELAAANEGTWGDRLAIELGYVTAQTFPAVVRPVDGGGGEIALPAGLSLPTGTLLRVRGPGLAQVGEFRWVLAVGTDRVGNPIATLDAPVGAAAATVAAAVVTATLDVVDGDPAFTRRESVSGLGLHPWHPRFLGRTVDSESELVRVVGGAGDRLPPRDPLLLPIRATRTSRGADRWAHLDATGFFDADPSDADPLDERPHRGVDLIGRQPEIGILCVPDLLWQWPGAVPAPAEPRPRPSAGFVRCDTDEPPPAVAYGAPPVPAARLDAGDAAQLAEIVTRQQRVVAVATLRRRFVTLLDVPPGLAVNDVTRWRAWFDTSYAAAYHPWLQVPRVATSPAAAQSALLVPPSIFAAGITAARERRLGLTHGPANELAVGAVGAAQRISDAEHERLHLLGVNVYRAERDGFRLTAARTLSSDPDYRQLSVRRLMTMLALTLDRQSQWLVFEPNTPDLRTQLTHTVVEFLRGLFRAGAFAGSTEKESFFVQCDDGVNPRQSQEQGRLIAEVGVAPASPLEYLVLRVSQDTDGRVRVEAQGG